MSLATWALYPIQYLFLCLVTQFLIYRRPKVVRALPDKPKLLGYTADVLLYSFGDLSRCLLLDQPKNPVLYQQPYLLLTYLTQRKGLRQPVELLQLPRVIYSFKQLSDLPVYDLSCLFFEILSHYQVEQIYIIRIIWLDNYCLRLIVKKQTFYPTNGTSPKVDWTQVHLAQFSQ